MTTLDSKRVRGAGDVFRRQDALPGDWFDDAVPIDKPASLTSFDVVRILRRATGAKKVGHAGTLDPMATGLLICLIGRATKRMSVFLEMPKTYEGCIRLGESTASYDADTPVTRRRDASSISDDDIEQARQKFLGTFWQRTPMYSAVRVGGERLYKKARRGETVRTPVRSVSVDSFDILSRRGIEIEFRLVCSKGTYVRSIANDIGEELGVGGHLVSLRRTRIGSVSVNDAWDLDRFVSAVSRSADNRSESNR